MVSSTVHQASVIETTPEEIDRKLNRKETFVLNIVTAWCPDCTVRQRPNMAAFVERIHPEGVEIYQLCVQLERLQFLSEAHRELTDRFGGHGYPRTVLVIDGAIASSEVEVTERMALLALADDFLAAVSAARS